MRAPYSKLRLRKIDTTKQSKAPTKNTTQEPRPKSTERTDTFSLLRQNASVLSKDIEDTPRFATGVSAHQLPRLSGGGFPQRKCGTDGMAGPGITGAHPREVSPQSDGLGGKVTGITKDTSSNSRMASGGDSKVEDGSDMEEEFQLTQNHHRANQSADLSTD